MRHELNAVAVTAVIQCTSELLLQEISCRPAFVCVIRDRASDRRLNAAEISGLTATARVVSIVMLRAGSCEKYCRYRYIAVT